MNYKSNNNRRNIIMLLGNDIIVSKASEVVEIFEVLLNSISNHPANLYDGFDDVNLSLVMLWPYTTDMKVILIINHTIGDTACKFKFCYCQNMMLSARFNFWNVVNRLDLAGFKINIEGCSSKLQNFVFVFW